MFKVRFNLERGKYYRFWQVCGDNTTDYYHPSNTFLSLTNCRLINNARTAKRIHTGANKVVCSWIQCDGVVAHDNIDAISQNKCLQIFYNPRIFPHWTDLAQNNIDKSFHKKIVTINNRVYANLAD